LSRSIYFAPAKIRRGRITLRITNADNDEHIFAINGVASSWIKPKQTTKLTVTFKRPGVYTASCPDDNGAGIAGLLKVT
jgi:plastocyanin